MDLKCIWYTLLLLLPSLNSMRLKSFFFLCQDCQNVSGSYPHFWDLLATLPCLLSVLFPLSWGWTNSIHPAYIFGFLLVCHVSLNGQSTGLLLHESQVSWHLAFTFSYFFYFFSIIHYHRFSKIAFCTKARLINYSKSFLMSKSGTKTNDFFFLK